MFSSGCCLIGSLIRTFSPRWSGFFPSPQQYDLLPEQVAAAGGAGARCSFRSAHGQRDNDHDDDVGDDVDDYDDDHGGGGEKEAIDPMLEDWLQEAQEFMEREEFMEALMAEALRADEEDVLGLGGSLDEALSGMSVHELTGDVGAS